MEENKKNEPIDSLYVGDIKLSNVDLEKKTTGKMILCDGRTVNATDKLMSIIGHKNGVAITNLNKTLPISPTSGSNYLKGWTVYSPDGSRMAIITLTNSNAAYSNSTIFIDEYNVSNKDNIFIIRSLTCASVFSILLAAYNESNMLYIVYTTVGSGASFQSINLVYTSSSSTTSFSTGSITNSSYWTKTNATVRLGMYVKGSTIWFGCLDGVVTSSLTNSYIFKISGANLTITKLTGFFIIYNGYRYSSNYKYFLETDAQYTLPADEKAIIAQLSSYDFSDIYENSEHVGFIKPRMNNDAPIAVLTIIDNKLHMGSMRWVQGCYSSPVAILNDAILVLSTYSSGMTYYLICIENGDIATPVKTTVPWYSSYTFLFDSWQPLNDGVCVVNVPDSFTIYAYNLQKYMIKINSTDPVDSAKYYLKVED